MGSDEDVQIENQKAHAPPPSHKKECKNKKNANVSPLKSSELIMCENQGLRSKKG